MRGWLLDTNILGYLTDRGDERHSVVNAQFQKVSPIEPIYISSITAGEIDYGIRANPKMPSEKKNLLRWSVEQFHILAVTDNTKGPYGEIRARLFENKVKKGKKSQRPEQLVDPVTSRRLGVQENDIWITAQAVERGLTLVTNDTKMQPLWEAAKDGLQVVNWADPEFGWPKE